MAKNYIIYQNENALYYECSYSCDNAIFLHLSNGNYFFTDGRYKIEAKKFVKNAKVVISSNILEELLQTLQKEKVKKVTIDPKEWDLFSFQKLKKLKLNIILEPDFSHKKRIIKTSNEIKLLDKAAKIGKKSFKKIAAMLCENIGLNEKELNFKAEAILRDFGKRELSFEPILAINKNAAKPHAIPSKTKLKANDLILLDAGIKYKRYCSDRTRTAFFTENFTFKKEQQFSKKKIQKAYDTVLKAQEMAIKKARSGMKAKEIDKIAREIIEKAGFGKYFVHSTGHGVGLDIHEMPYISPKSETIIEDGMVFTIEPGIYIQDKFGIRIEDMVVMQKGRAHILG